MFNMLRPANGDEILASPQFISDHLCPEIISDTRVRQVAASADTKELVRLLEARANPHSRSQAGKTALHLAAWRGAIGNIKALLDHNANLDEWSTGEHNYGKTALFYAITRCREEVVCALLEYGATARIVNNKGQTPLSLAITHLSQETQSMIRRSEELEACAWKTFRESHSDGLVYGDVDPRFCTEAAACEVAGVLRPTTHESRRGNFARNNPTRVKQGTLESNTAVREGGLSGADIAARVWGTLPSSRHGNACQVNTSPGEAYAAFRVTAAEVPPRPPIEGLHSGSATVVPTARKLGLNHVPESI